MTTIVMQSTDLVTVREAAHQLGRPHMTIYRWIEAGKLLAARFDGILYIPRSEVERLKAEKAHEHTRQ